jgi:hypothetical protein
LSVVSDCSCGCSCSCSCRFVLTVVGKLTGDNKSFLIKQQEQVDKLYKKIAKAKYGSALNVGEAKFVNELKAWETLYEVLRLR